MENIEPIRAQIASIIVSLGFLIFIAFLIIKGKLRAEYSIIWIISSLILVIFSFWRSGLELMARWIGIYLGINLAFAAAILAIFIYLLHLSIVASKLYEQNKALAQQVALLKEKINNRKTD